MKFPLNEKGAAAVEFVLVVIPLLIILFGIIEFSLCLYDQAVITNASREGARYGILLFKPDEQEIRNVVAAYTADNLISFGSTSPAITVSSTSTTSPVKCTQFGDELTVEVSYQYDFLLIPSFISTLSDWITLRATATMMCEG